MRKGCTAVKFSKFMIVCALAFGCSMASFNTAAYADNDLVRDALKAFKQNNYTQANTLIDKHLANNPKDAQAQYAKAMILYKMGHYIKALQRLEIVLQLSPKNHNAAESYAAINQQAVYHLNQGKNDQAIQQANKAIEIMPKWNQREFKVALAGCYFAKGTAYFENWCLSNKQEDFDVALASWDKTRELDPTSATQQLTNGIKFFISGDYDMAKKLFDDGISIRPQNKYLQLWQSFANASAGENKLAMMQLDDLVSLFGRNPVLHLYKGDLDKTTGDYQAAQSEYTTAMELRPEDRRINTALKTLFLCSGQIDNGIAYYAQLQNQNPQSFAAYYNLASFQQEAGLPEAATSFKNASSMSGVTALQAATAKVQVALIYLEQGNIKSAQECITPEELQILAASKSPLASLYQAYTEEQPNTREKAAREALEYSGPDAIFIHRSAFNAMAMLEDSRKQYAKEMEYIYQVWRRTPSTSPVCQSLQERFAAAKTSACGQIQSKISKTRKAKGGEDAVAKLEEGLNTINNLSLSGAGAMLGQVQGIKSAADSNLVPAELLSGVVLSPRTGGGSWVNVTPDWQTAEAAAQ